MNYYGIDYERQIVKEVLDKYKLEISEYSVFSFRDFSKWIDKLKNKFNTDLIKIDCYTSTEYDDSSCCGREYTIMNFVPYMEREENDIEYAERIAYEKQICENARKIKEIREANQKQYEEDLKEYNRIKEKYKLP